MDGWMDVWVGGWMMYGWMDDWMMGDGIRPGAALAAWNSARRRTRSSEFGPAPHAKWWQQRLLGPCLLTRRGSG